MTPARQLSEQILCRHPEMNNSIFIFISVFKRFNISFIYVLHLWLGVYIPDQQSIMFYIYD